LLCIIILASHEILICYLLKEHGLVPGRAHSVLISALRFLTGCGVNNSDTKGTRIHTPSNNAPADGRISSDENENHSALETSSDMKKEVSFDSGVALPVLASVTSTILTPMRKRPGTAAALDAPNDYDDDDKDDYSKAHALSLVHDDAPGSVAVTAFNLDDELQEGALDASGEFVPSALAGRAAASPPRSVDGDSSDEDEEEVRLRSAAEARRKAEDERDDWVELEEGKSRPAPAYDAGSGASTSSRAPAKRPRVRDSYDDNGEGEAANLAGMATESELRVCLAQLLQDGETPAGAIRRLKKAGDVGSLEKVTELCDGLMGLGVFVVYELRRAAVLDILQWELTWGAEGGRDKVHGPFTAAYMVAWAQSGFFSHPEKIGWVRPTGISGEWLLASTLFVTYNR
jgi:hypothetical protein